MHAFKEPVVAIRW